ncbi:hypothetical protein ABTK41_20200, partial [Acinetobacter baumannii]
QHTGLALSISKAGTPAGPGGSSSCALTGKPLQSMDVQLWRGSSARRASQTPEEPFARQVQADLDFVAMLKGLRPSGGL